MVKDDFFNSANPNVLYDLRQTYAMQILTPILLMIEDARTKREYKKWFDLLDDNLYTNIQQKLTDDEKEDYENKKKETIQIINQYPNVFNGRDTSPEGNYKIKDTLKKLEMWLKSQMEDKALYGKGSEYDMDEI